MRLSEFQRRVIRDSVIEELGVEARVFLFGSRLNDAARGGDIDLLVEVPALVPDPMRSKLKIVSRIQRRIGDQKIDLILMHPGMDETEAAASVVAKASQEGVCL